MLGRIVLASALANAQHLPRMTFHYGFSFDLGGGEYGRASSFEADQPATAQVPTATLSPLPSFDNIAAALTSLRTGGGAIEITESGRFVESIPDVTANGVAVEVRAADGRCPAVLLRPGGGGLPWTLQGNANGAVSLNGLWLAGLLRVTGNLGKFRLGHCTLTPGWGTNAAGSIVAAPDAFLELSARQTQVLIENCILPPLRVGADGARVHLRNCIIDAGAEDKFALSNLTADGPAGSWRLENCTVIGDRKSDKHNSRHKHDLFRGVWALWVRRWRLGGADTRCSGGVARIGL
jgi:hypothetical protein